MNTFEKYFEDFPDFLETILAWHPHHIVPVAKKACKLLKTIPTEAFRTNPDLVKYRNYFKLSNVSVHNKRIAVIDDATQHTATLQEYRRYFENLGADVRTFSFVGHEAVVQGARWKEDRLAEISKSLSEPVYQEYILQQAYHLLKSGNHFDLDHLVFEIPFHRSQLSDFLRRLRTLGLLLSVPDYFLKTKTRRFSLDDVEFFHQVPFLEDKSVELGPLRKIKFAFDPVCERLFFSPLVFPTWNFRKCEIGAPLFRDVPFKLPYDVPNLIDKANEGSLLRVYYNLQFATAISLAKAFVQEVFIPEQLADKLELRHNDLDALLGAHKTIQLFAGIKKFVGGTARYDFRSGRPSKHPRVQRQDHYTEFGEVIDELRRGYEDKLQRTGSRIGVHYYLPYDRLFEGFQDKAALSEGLDYYCDFGILVPETLIDRSRGKVLRVCRAGEPQSDFNWRRTQVIIPLAIDEFCTAEKTNSVEATALNKLLANFLFDYPSDLYHELHCLVGEPYMYGTMVRAYHPHRAPRKPTLYETDRISEFYTWSKSDKTFSLKKRRQLVSQAQEVFDERQEIPYSEIVTYFRFLSTIYQLFKKGRHFRYPVDVLNMLAICREENYFFAHLVFNVTSTMEEIGLSFEGEADDKRKHVRAARDQVFSADDKIAFAHCVDEAMEKLTASFETNLEFAGVFRRFRKNRKPFSTTFHSTLTDLRKLVELQLVLTSLRLAKECENSRFLDPLKDIRFQEILNEVGLTSMNDARSLIHDDKRYLQVSSKIYENIRDRHAALPRAEPLLLTRLNLESLERAKNTATHFVYQNHLSRLTLLYIDFTGLRSIPEPKEEVISRYYRIVMDNSRRRSGELLYGGRGGDDAFTIAFREIAPALQCAKDIKQDFADDLFLNSEKRDVKFGISFVIFDSDQKEEQIVQCWGDAKDCCEFKGGFKNRGNLIVSSKTLENLARDKFPGTSKFVRITNEMLRGRTAIYSYRDIVPLSRA